MTTETLFDTEWENHAAYLGADAAMAAASWVTMSESDAQSILEDVDPEVLDRYPMPDLSGEWADDPTPASILRDVGGDDGDFEYWDTPTARLRDEVADAWEAGRDAVWHAALEAVTLRTVGRIDDALRVERECEATVAAFRKCAGF